MITNSKNASKDSADNEVKLHPGYNYLSYKYCVHIFEGDTKNGVWVQSNHEGLLKEIVEAWAKKHEKDSCEQKSPYLLKISYSKYGEFLEKIESIVNRIINVNSGNIEYILKFYENLDELTNKDLKHFTTIIMW